MRLAARANDTRRWTGRHKPPAAIPTLGPEIQHPIGFGNDIQVVLNDNHRVPVVHQALQHTDQPNYISHVQANRGLVQHIESGPDGSTGCRFRCRYRSARQLGHQFDSLRLAATQRGALLTQRQIPQSHILQQP